MKSKYFFQKLFIFLFYVCTMVLFQNCGQGFEGATDADLEALNNSEGESSEVLASLSLNTGLSRPNVSNIITTSVGVRVFYSVGAEIEKINLEINNSFHRTYSVTSTSGSVFVGNNHFQQGLNSVKIIGILGQERSQPSALYTFQVIVSPGPGNIIPQASEPEVGSNLELPRPNVSNIITTSVGVRVFYAVSAEVEKINLEINNGFHRTYNVTSTSGSVFVGNNHFQQGRNSVKIIGIRGQELSQPSALYTFQVIVSPGPGNIIPQASEPEVGSNPGAGSSLVGIPQNVQYVQPGFTSSVLMYNGLRACRVPTENFNDVQEDSGIHSRLENFINDNSSIGNPTQACSTFDFQ